MARTFEPGGIHIDGVTGEGYIRVFINNDDLTPHTHEEALNYFMSFDPDGNGWLDQDQFATALDAMGADGALVNRDMVTRLGRLFASNLDGGEAFGFSADDIATMMTEGVLLTSNGMSQGFAVDLNAVTNERVVDRMFKFVGKNPAVDTLTARDFDEGTDHVMGDWMPIREDSANYLAEVHGSEQSDGTFAMTVLQVLGIFSSKDVTRGDATGRAFIPIVNNVSASAPVHHEASWWDSVLGFFGDEAKSVIATMSDIVDIAETDLANILNGKMTLEEALGAGAVDIGTKLYEAVVRGEEDAVALMDQLGSAIKEGVHELSDAGKAFVDTIVADAKAGGKVMAVKMLAAMSGMTSEQSKEAIESAGAKMEKITHMSSLTFDDMKAMIPDFDSHYAQAIKLQREVLELTGGSDSSSDTSKAVTVQEMFSDLDSPQRAGFSRRLQSEGLSVDMQGRLLKKTGEVATQADKQDFYDKFMRIDYAVEANATAVGAGGPFGSGSLDAFQGRLFFTAPRVDKEGNEFMEFRIRELDLAGAALGSEVSAVDGGLAAIHDVVISFDTAPDKVGTKRDVIYNSTTALIAEWTPGIKMSSDEIKEMLGFSGVNTGDLPGDIELPTIPGSGQPNLFSIPEGSVPSMPSIPEGSVPSMPSTFGISLEIGGGAGLTTSYNLTKMGGSAWEPFVSELGGALVGGAVTGAVLLGSDIATDGALTEFIAKWGDTALHAGAIVGGTIADLINAAAYDEVTTTFSGFVWGAGIISYNQPYSSPDDLGPGLDGSLRGRVQFNVNTADVTVIA